MKDRDVINAFVSFLSERGHPGLKSWIIDDAPRLDDGRYFLDNIPDIPFRLHIKKASDRTPRIIFGRFQPSDETLPKRIHTLFERKAKKLLKYKAKGKTTILLVETEDIALMNETILFKSIKEAYPDKPPTGIDQVWHADTAIPDDIEFMEIMIK